MSGSEQVTPSDTTTYNDLKIRIDRVEKLLILAIVTNAPTLFQAIRIWLGA